MGGDGERAARLGVLAFLSGAIVAVMALALAGPTPAADDDDASLRRQFQRPAAIPYPPGNEPTPARIALGRRLFHEPRLSADGRVSCATCHDPALAFADGVALTTAGATGRPLRRHSPALWNLAWAPHLFWDGRAPSLEEQARGPISHPDEMASSPEAAAARLAADPAYAAAFAAAFPDAVSITGDQVLKALASYERTLVSPRTRFDRWVAGEDDALNASERNGLRLFMGKAQCSNCHTGFAFTDHAFHDIGLPGDDLGRGPVIEVPAVERAFKTPGLRELAWTAPYMHDGSLATLEDVLRHYESGGLERATRSRELPRALTLSDEERLDLIAFLDSLSSERPPVAPGEVRLAAAPEAAETAVRAVRISQKDRAFTPRRVRIARGERLVIHNDDTRTHNVRIVDPRLAFNSGAQEPGEDVSILFGASGLYEAHCGIHPTMRLTVEVE